jgi:hypothetical protein
VNSYIWNDAPLAKNYTKLTFSVMFEELGRNFRSISNSTSSLEKARLYIGHDGSMIRLASGLGIKGPLRWPALGSEIVMEVGLWSRNSATSPYQLTFCRRSWKDLGDGEGFSLSIRPSRSGLRSSTSSDGHERSEIERGFPRPKLFSARFKLFQR